MQNLASVAQKMAELLHYYIIITDMGARSKGSCREIFKTLPFGNSWDKMDLTQQATSSGIGANIQIHILTQFTYYHLKSPTLI